MQEQLNQQSMLNDDSADVLLKRQAQPRFHWNVMFLFACINYWSHLLIFLTTQPKIWPGAPKPCSSTCLRCGAAWGTRPCWPAPSCGCSSWNRIYRESSGWSCTTAPGARRGTTPPASSLTPWKKNGCPLMWLSPCSSGSSRQVSPRLLSHSSLHSTYVFSLKQITVRLPEDEQNFQLRMFCECGQPAATFSFSISGTEEVRGDTATVQQMSEQPPYVLTTSIPQNMDAHLTSRKKRSTAGQETCTA